MTRIFSSLNASFAVPWGRDVNFCCGALIRFLPISFKRTFKCNAHSISRTYQANDPNYDGKPQGDVYYAWQHFAKILLQNMTPQCWEAYENGYDAYSLTLTIYVEGVDNSSVSRLYPCLRMDKLEAGNSAMIESFRHTISAYLINHIDSDNHVYKRYADGRKNCVICYEFSVKHRISDQAQIAG